MRSRIAPALVLLALAACDDGAGPDAADLTADEAVALSEAMADDDFAYAGGLAQAGDPAGEGVALDPVTATTEFSGTRPCPVSGQVAVEGTRVRTWDPDTQAGTSDLSFTKTHQACARTVRGVVITVNGDPNIAVEAHHAWADGGWSGLQTLSIQGGFTWLTEDGREGRCAIAIEASYDPGTMTRTVSGTICDRTFERTTTWSTDG